jgi:hypothetical protein
MRYSAQSCPDKHADKHVPLVPKEDQTDEFPLHHLDDGEEKCESFSQRKEALRSGKINKADGLEQIQSVNTRQKRPVVNKRAILGFMPLDKKICRGICGLTVLGSKAAP